VVQDQTGIVLRHGLGNLRVEGQAGGIVDDFGSVRDASSATSAL